MVDEFDTKHGNMVAVGPFYVTNAVTAQTNVDLEISQAGISTVPMPKAGSVVGISVKSSANVTAGSSTFTPHKASTEFAASGFPTAVLSSAAASSNASVGTCRPKICTFAANDPIGVSYTSTSDCAPTNTNDYMVNLFVVFDRD